MDSHTTPLNLTTSVAKASDYAMIARLCRRAVSRSDYVLRILPTIIANGGLFLVWDGGVLVGMTNFDKCIDGSGWLSAARTDPGWRGRGVATFLQREIAAYARLRGVRVLRMWVSSENRSSLRACARGGFKQVCEAAHISKTLRNAKPRRRITLNALREVELRALLESRYVAKTRGYVGYRRYFIKLTMNLLVKLRRRGELYSSGGCVFLITHPDTLFRAPQSSLTALQGPFTDTLETATCIARDRGARVLASYIPYSQYELSAARRLGFRRSPWGRHCLVFEKGI